jgi:dihydroorotate dehydrogenase electron transfer subunit
MVAGGVGLAPFITLAEALVARGTQAILFYGARRAADLHCADLFERLGIHLVFATEDGTRGSRGLITAPLEAALQRLPASRTVRLYVCGPTPMMRAVASIASANRRPCDVSLEQVMGCGMGGCYSCVVPARDPGGTPHHTRSCIDGPVFDASRIVWEALAH